MKRDTCKTLLIIGIGIFVFFFILIFLSRIAPIPLALLGGFTLVFLLPIALILIIVSLILWNSEKREQERQEVRRTQLKALKRGNVDVSLKGKIRKLK